MKKTNLFLLTIIFSTLVFAGCTSVKEIPESLTSAQLIQQGQNAYGSGDYHAAELYYDAVIDRFGEDTPTYVEAKYELGHLYLKTKSYKKAMAAFNEILELYDVLPAGTLPASYKKLALIGINQVPENKQK